VSPMWSSRSELVNGGGPLDEAPVACGVGAGDLNGFVEELDAIVGDSVLV
jgi:hypothetical protein